MLLHNLVLFFIDSTTIGKIRRQLSGLAEIDLTSSGYQNLGHRMRKRPWGREKQRSLRRRRAGGAPGPQQRSPCSPAGTNGSRFSPAAHRAPMLQQGDISWTSFGCGEPCGNRLFLKGCSPEQLSVEQSVRRKERLRGAGVGGMKLLSLPFLASPKKRETSATWGQWYGLGKGMRESVILTFFCHYLHLH